MKINALEYICDKIIESHDFNINYECLLKLSSENIFSNNFNLNETKFSDIELNRILKYCDFLSSSNKSFNKNLALKLVALIDSLSINNEYKEIVAKSVLTKFGLFSAADIFISKNTQISVTSSIIGDIRKVSQNITGTKETYTNNQYDLYKEILKEKYFSFSGPTSIGKSFLIKSCAVELSIKYQNIIFILPTKALLDEFIISFRKIINEQNIDNLNIGKSISKIRRDKNNILVLTQERYNSFLYDPEFSDIKIDILFVDEAHKLTEKKNKRAITLFKVINKSLACFPDMKLIFSCPVISNPEILFNLFNIQGVSRTIKESPVAQNLYSIDIGEKKYQYFDTVTNRVLDLDLPKSYSSDCDLIYSVGMKSDSNLIYFSNKQDCINKALSFKKHLVSIGTRETDDKELLDESNLISNFIHNEFSLVELLKYNIAFHHGSLPPFIRKRIEDLYAKRKIKYIFCTSTLLEGVNLPTKNVFIYPFKISDKETGSRLDFWNLAGRAGRYKNELTGNIFCINNLDNSFSNKEIFTENEVKLTNDLTPILTSNRKILNYLNDNVQNPTPAVVQFSTIILSEILDLNKNNIMGPNLSSISYSNRSKVIEAGKDYLVRKNISDINISIFSESHTINSEIQSKAFAYAKEIKNSLNTFKRNDVFDYINKINEIYNIFNNKVLYIYQNLAYSWIRGKSINNILNDSIKYSTKVNINYQWVDFDINNSDHVNNKISHVISTIENDIGFKLETSVNHFYQLCKSIHGENDAGINLAKFLEYGTTDSKEMSIQEYGFSRVASIQILKNYKVFLDFNEKDELVSIDLKKIIEKSENNVLLNREAKWLC